MAGPEFTTTVVVKGSTDGAGSATYSTGRTDWRELAIVAALLALIHIFLWSRSLPLPYQDLSFYFEPAILLAKYGWLAGPGNHYHDLTYVRGIYFYPPGLSLFLGGWVALFGASAAAFLAYTNFVHFAYLTALWALLRGRLGCTRLAAGLALFGAFPMFGHGRADLTALLLGVLGWLALPTRSDPRRTVLAAIPLGLAVLVSPPFGISSAAAVGVFFLAGPDGTLKERAKGFATLTGSAIVTFVAAWAAVLTWQDDWGYGLAQFALNSRVRASELNTLPGFSPYLIAFSLIPLGLLTLGPVLFALFAGEPEDRKKLRRAVLSYLAGFVAWFALSKAPLLTGGHFSYLARPVIHGVVGSARGWLGRIGIATMAAFAIVHWYHQKETLLALTQHYSRLESRVNEIQLPPEEIVALDSDVFPYLYRDGRSITYELMGFDYWRRSLAGTSPQTLAALGVAGCTSPVVPDRVVVSARGLMNFGPPDSTRFVPLTGRAPSVELVRFLGRTLRFPQDPSAVHVFVRRSGSAAVDAAALEESCRLLPAVPPA